MDIHRFANISRMTAFAAKKGLNIEQVVDVFKFQREDILAELMRAPFERKRMLANKFGLRSRYSDGEWPVFYGAIDRATAQEESVYHYGRKAAGDTVARGPVHYSIVSCIFSGEAVDLRPKLLEWPDLISENYEFCNSLGREAHDGGLGGFLSPSARHEGGTTVPAFLAETLSSPIVEAAAKLTFDAESVEVEVKEVR